jgi:hypothetical protein
MTHGGKRAAFTLAEVLVGLAVASAAIGLGVEFAFVSAQLWRRQQARCEGARAGWQSVQRLCGELRMVMPPDRIGEGQGLAGEHRTRPRREALGDLTGSQSGQAPARIDDDAVRFPCARVTDAAGRTGPGVVEYFLKRDARGRVVGLARRAAWFGRSLRQEAPALVAPEVVSLRLEYLDEHGHWLREWSDGAGLPRAVRVTAGTRAADAWQDARLMHFSSVVHVPAAGRVSR